LPDESTLRVTDADVAVGLGVDGRVGVRFCPSANRGVFVGRLVASSVRGHEHAVMVDVHEPTVADDLDGLTGQPDTG
jgi:hypothetical protein